MLLSGHKIRVTCFLVGLQMTAGVSLVPSIKIRIYMWKWVPRGKEAHPTGWWSGCVVATHWGPSQESNSFLELNKSQ